MPMIKKSITVTDQQEAWIQRQISAGLYGNDSEVIREALREKQLRMAEVEAIRAKLLEAEERGASGKTPEDIRQAVKAKLAADGEI